MLKQEYTLIDIDDMQITLSARQDRFNRLGRQGWIFCGTDAGGNYIFRRPIDPNPEGEK